MALLGAEKIREELKKLPGWRFVEDKNAIERVYETKNFKETSLLINLIIGLAEAHFHHPDVEFGYKKVRVVLSTHSEGGVTEKDISLAGDIEKFASSIMRR